MLIKKETEYAILGIISLAKCRKRLDIKALAKKESISNSLLSKVFQKLARAGIVESKLGPSGGFQLAKKPNDVNLLEIIKAVQDISLLKCYSGKAPYCPKKYCPLRGISSLIEDQIYKFLTTINLNQLANY